MHPSPMMGAMHGQAASSSGTQQPDQHQPLPPELHHSHGAAPGAPSQAHAIAQMQHHQQEVLHSAHIMGVGPPHEQPGPGVPMQMMQPPGGAPPQFPPGRSSGALPMMMYPPPHMMMSGPLPNMGAPQASGVPQQQGAPVFMPGPPHQLQHMMPMMAMMPSVPMQPQQQPHQGQGFPGGMMGGAGQMGGPNAIGPAGLPGHPGVPGGPRLAGGDLPGRFSGGQPGAPRQAPSTTLRASAPSFVPGGFKSSNLPAPGEDVCKLFTIPCKRAA